MDLSFIKNDLETKGYCLVPDVLSPDEAQQCANEFKKWQQSIPNHDEFYKYGVSNGIYKHHQVGHTWHAWFVRTRPRVQEVFKHIWDCDDLIVSFDGSCYIPKEYTKQTRFWTVFCLFVFLLPCRCFLFHFLCCVLFLVNGIYIIATF